MQIKEILLTELKPYENNPRKNDYAVNQVAKSIEKFGFKIPIVIDKDNIIICGHTRFKAAQILELEKIPCIVAEDLTEEQIKAFRLVDNKTAEFSNWDFDKLNTELLSLELSNIDIKDFQFEIKDFSASKGKINEGEELDIEDFSDEKFNCTCPKCGFKFNR